MEYETFSNANAVRISISKGSPNQGCFYVMYRHSEDMTVVSHLLTRSQIADVGNVM